MKTDDPKTAERKAFAEEVGITLEGMGLPRMAGRVWGWLLVCDPPQQSAADLAAALSASRGSISTTTRLLIQFGLIERIGLSGRRSGFYRIREGGLRQLTRIREQQTSVLRHMAERGLEVVKEEPPRARRHLEEMRDTYSFFEREFPKLVEKWEREQKGQK